MWTLQDASETFRTLSGRTHLDTFGHFGHFWMLVDMSGKLQKLWDISGQFWTHWEISGHYWTPPGPVGHVLTLQDALGDFGHFKTPFESFRMDNTLCRHRTWQGGVCAPRAAAPDLCLMQADLRYTLLQIVLCSLPSCHQATHFPATPFFTNDNLKRFTNSGSSYLHTYPLLANYLYAEFTSQPKASCSFTSPTNS